MAIKDYLKYWSTGNVQGITNQVMMDKDLTNLRALNDMSSPNYVGQSYFDLIKDNNPLSPVQGEYGSGFPWLIVGAVFIVILLILKK